MTQEEPPRAINSVCLELHHETFHWCVRSAGKALSKGNLEDAAQWSLLAAQTAEIFGHNQLASPELEEILIKLANLLPGSPLPGRAPASRKRWLHVFSKTYGVGGHTALATRWIQLDPNKDEHSLVLTFQEIQNVSSSLSEAVKASGGSVTAMTEEGLLLDRAQQLRTLAYNNADYIVLHTHAWDILPTVAFGISVGPPVLLLNHGDHVFWVGASVADLVLNLRVSGEHFTKSYRGVSRTFQLPIPLPFKPPSSGMDIRLALRKELKIPQNAIVFLTIGTPKKYKTSPELNFLDTARQIIERLPEAYLIAVGPKKEDPEWIALHRTTQGRVIAIGIQGEVAGYLSAADVYLEGFPFGSLTALLEAGAALLPCVRAPETCPLPFRSDGLALDALPTPVDVAAYIETALELGRNEGSRAALGRQMSDRIRNIHCDTNWSSHLHKLVSALPLRHEVNYLSNVANVPKSIEEYWCNFILQGTTDNAVSYCFRSAYEQHLKPRLDLKLWSAMRAARRCGYCRVGNPTRTLLGSSLLSVIPSKFADFLYHKT